MSSKKQSWRWIVGGILFLAFLLRVPLLNGSLWLDEAAQALESARPFSQQLQIVDDFQPPLLHYLVHALLQVNRSEWWLRLGAALIPGLVTIWGTFVIGERLFSRRVGTIAAFLLALSSFHIFYSQELRPYSLPAMFAVLSWVSALRLMVPVQKNYTRDWMAYIVLTVGGLYSSYLYPFLWAGQMLYLLWQKEGFAERLKAVGFGGVIPTVFFLPWLPMFFAQLQAGQSLRTDLPGWEKVVSFDQVKSIALTGGKFVFGVLDLEFSLSFILIAGILGGGMLVTAWRIFRQRTREELVRELAPVICWLILPILFAWIVSFVVPVLQPKRVLFSLPAFYVLLAYGIEYWWEKKSEWGKVAVSFLAAVQLFSTFQYYTQPKYQREDWRSLHREITQKYPASQSVAVFAFPEPFAPWRWYDSGEYPAIATGVLSTSSLSDLEFLKKATDARYILVFDYLRDLTDSENKVVKTIESYGYEEVDRITPQTPIGFVSVYARKTSILTQQQ